MSFRFRLYLCAFVAKRFFGSVLMNDLIIDNQFNIGHICTRQQCELGRADKVAMRWVGPHLERRDYSFSELDAQSNRFANALETLGLAKGDVFFTFLPKMPEQFFALLGALKLQVICGTLFSNFGDDAILDRLGDAQAKCVITKKSFLKKIGRIRSQLPALTHIIVVDGEDDPANGIVGYRGLMEAASPAFLAQLTDADTPSLLHYTSGSTGKPKGVLHRHNSVLSQNKTAREVLQLETDDIYWCTADQGWVTGTSYGIIGPWSIGVTQLHFGGAYDASVWFDLLEQEKISIWYSAPTALRMLMREDPEIFSRHPLAALRHIFSVGEPLNPEVIHWARRTLNREIYDTWFQTETGAILISPLPGATPLSSATTARRYPTGNRETSASDRVGPRCSPPTSTTPRSTGRSSGTATITRAIRRTATPTATSGSWGEATT